MTTITLTPEPAGDQTSVSLTTKLDGYTIKWAAQNTGERVEIWQNTSNNRATATKVATVADTYYDSPTLTVGTTYYIWTRRLSVYDTVGDWDLGASAGRTVLVTGVSNNVVNFNQTGQDFTINCKDLLITTVGEIDFSTNGLITFSTFGLITFSTFGSIDFSFVGTNTFGGVGVTEFTGLQNVDFAMDGIITLSTATAGGTGAVTQNTLSGRVTAAAASTSLVVTCNRVTASSIVVAVASTNDTTGYVTSVVPAAGSFTIYYTAPTANMNISWHTFN